MALYFKQKLPKIIHIPYNYGSDHNKNIRPRVLAGFIHKAI